MSKFSSSKLFEDEDDDLAGPSRKSGLGNLFGAATQTTSADNSLNYQRPKAPAKDASLASSGSTSKPGSAKLGSLPSLLHNCRVELYKTGTSPAEYTPVGAAIVENASSSTKFQLILYITRDKLIAGSPIGLDFVLNIQNQDGVNYGSFHDKTSKKDWSFRFTNQDEADMLAVHIALAKHYEDPSQTLLQDILVPPKGNSAVKEDALGIRYVLYHAKQGKLTAPIEDNTSAKNPTKWVVGGPNKTSYPGWDIALDGIKKGGKRIVLVPGEGDQPIIYKLFAEKMKRASGDESAPPKSGRLNREESSDDLASQQAENSSETTSLVQKLAKLGAQPTPFAGTPSKSQNASSDNHTEAAVTTESNPVTSEATPSPNQSSQQPQQTAQSQQQQQFSQPNFNQQPQNIPMMQPQMPQNNFGGYNPSFGTAGATSYGANSNFGFQPQQPATTTVFTANGPMQVPTSILGANSNMNQPFGGAQGFANSSGALSLYTPQPQNIYEMMAAQGMFGPQLQAQAQAAAAAAAAQKPKEEPASSTSSSSNDKKDTTNEILTQAEAIQLLIDGRQFQSEIKSSLSKMSTQLESVEERMEDTVFTKSKDLGGGVSAKILLQTVSRIVGENEKMATEIESRDARIDQLTIKLNKLHETNQKVIEENNRFMEERTTNMKTATDSQIRQLEQFREEKTNLEMELTSANRQFQTLKRSFANVSSELETLKEESARLQAERDAAVSKYSGVATSSQTAEAKLIDSETARRKLELDLQTLRDDLALEKESLENVRRELEERKTKANRDLANQEARLQAEKAELEDTVSKLQEQIRSERANLGQSHEQAQADIESKWTSKLKAETQRTQAALEAQYESKMESYKAHIDELAREKFRQVVSQYQAQIADLNSDIETERQNWLTKEGSFRRQIAQLQEIQVQFEHAQEFVAKLKAQLADAASSNASIIKEIMNGVYMGLNELFESGEGVQYEKDGIMNALKFTIINTTKAVTDPDAPKIDVPKPMICPPVEVKVEVPVEVRVEVPVEKEVFVEKVVYANSSSDSQQSSSTSSNSIVAQQVLAGESVFSESELAKTQTTLDQASTMVTDHHDENHHHEESQHQHHHEKSNQVQASNVLIEPPTTDPADVSVPQKTTIKRLVKKKKEKKVNANDDPLAAFGLGDDEEEDEYEEVEEEVAVEAAVQQESHNHHHHHHEVVVENHESSITNHVIIEDPVSSATNADEVVDASNPAVSSIMSEEDDDIVRIVDPPIIPVLNEGEEPSHIPLEPPVQHHMPNPLGHIESHMDIIESDSSATSLHAEENGVEKPTESSEEPNPLGDHVQSQTEAPNHLTVDPEDAKLLEQEIAIPSEVKVDPEDAKLLEQEIAVRAVPKPTKSPFDDAEDDDPFGLDEDIKQKDDPVVAAPKQEEAVVNEEEEEAPTVDIKAPVAVIDVPSFEDPFATSNNSEKKSTPKKGGSLFDDDEDVPPRSSTPSTEPKKKTTSFFDEEEDTPISSKKTSEVSSASSTPKPQKKDALDDIFGFSGGGSSVSSKGLFD